jgi:hypothetical protein
MIKSQREHLNRRQLSFYVQESFENTWFLDDLTLKCFIYNLLSLVQIWSTLVNKKGHQTNLLNARSCKKIPTKDQNSKQDLAFILISCLEIFDSLLEI